MMTARLVNSRETAIKLHVEPWGEVYELPPGAVIEVLARGPAGDGLEVTVDDAAITVWGWPGSVVTLFQDGVELGAGAGEREPVPPMPPLKASARLKPA